MAADKNLDLNAVWRVIEKFKDSVLRLGVNLYEHFTKFDPNGEQLISEYFFRKVLEVCLKNEVPLSEDEIRILVNYFQYRDGRIMYSELCDRVHDKGIRLKTDVKSNLVTGLEWEDPLRINALKPDEETKLLQILSQIASVLVKWDHPIDVHFKEYEQIARNPGCVSLNHLARIFNKMSIHLNQMDFNLVVKRYGRHSFMFNYIPFLDEVNAAIKCYVSSPSFRTDMRYVLNSDPEKVRRPDIRYPKCQERGKEMGLPVSFKLLRSYHTLQEGPNTAMKRIKQHVITNGIDLRRIFCDLDKLRSGLVTSSNFRRALTNAGINCGVNSRLYIKEDDLETLEKIYTKPNEKNAIMWNLFFNDVLIGTVKQELSDKSFDEASDMRFVPAQGNVWSITPEEIRIRCEETLERLRRYLLSRRWTLRQFFSEWDTTNNGHVSLLYFRNILSSNNLVTDPLELDALEKRYADSKGFDYITLLNELRCESLPGEDETKTPDKSTTKSQSIKSVESLVDPCYKRTFTDDEIADAIRRIRRQIVVNSLKLDDVFKQFDSLNKHVVSKQEFLRALASHNVEFTDDEAEILTTVFKAPLQNNRVEYTRFLDTVEEAYTQNHIDKAPLIVPVKHIPVIDEPDRFLNMEERRLVETALNKLSDKVSMTNYDDARCYDHVKGGDWSSNQFVQFLDYTKIKLSRSEKEALTKAFGRDKGGVRYLEYLPLLKAVDILYKQKRMS